MELHGLLAMRNYRLAVTSGSIANMLEEPKEFWRNFELNRTLADITIEYRDARCAPSPFGHSL
jgi:hypothetical protein